MHGQNHRLVKTTTERGMLGVESQDHKIEKDHDRTKGIKLKCRQY